VQQQPSKQLAPLPPAVVRNQTGGLQKAPLGLVCWSKLRWSGEVCEACDVKEGAGYDTD